MCDNLLKREERETMVSLNLQVTENLLSSLVTVLSSLSKEQHRTYKEEVKHLRLFLANAQNTFSGNHTNIIDVDYWEVNQETKNPFWGGEYSNNEENSREHSK